MTERGAGTAGPTERELEGHALELLGECGWQPVDGAELAPSSGERTNWDDLVLRPRLSEAIGRRYPHLPERSVDDAVTQLLEQATGNDLRESHRFHQRLVGGIGVLYPDAVGGGKRHTVVRPVDFSDPYANDLLAARQVKVRNAQDRVAVFDIVLYVNGLPLAAIELKQASGRGGVRDAYDQIQGFRRDLKETGTFANVLVTVVSDGPTARIGTPFTPWDHMAPWHADPDGTLLPQNERQDGRALERMLLGAFEPARLLDLVANFLSYSARRTGEVDTVTLARAHQFFAVNAAVRATEIAVATDGRAGVVRHAQGAGRSQEMLFYVGKAARAPELPHPMFVVLTDRVDLGNRLYAAFTANCTLPTAIAGGVEWAQDSTQLRQLLRRDAHSGVVFATVQKFRLTHEERDAGARHPLVSARRDIIVMVDEAHRGQSALHALNLREALPNATFIAFTGTLADDRNGRTHAVFGDTIHIYDLAQAVDDGTAVPVFYESRLIRTLPDDVDLCFDPDPDVGSVPDAADLAASSARTEALARDILAHWDVRRAEMAKLTGRPGKGMVVTSSRLAAARLFDALARLRPEWADGRDPRTGLLSDTGGRIRAAVTGHIGDPVEIADHVHTPEGLRTIQRRIVDPNDELELVIVRSLWLTGFDVPPLHTLYLDQRMRGPALLEAVTLVNRTWDGKPSGLVVDYQGVGPQLTEVLADATWQDRDGGAPITDVAHAVDAVRDNHRRLLAILAGCPWREIRDGSGPDTYREAVTAVLDHLVAPEPGARSGTARRGDRFTRHVNLMRGAFSLCSTDAGVRDLLPDIRFFEAVRTMWERLAASADGTGGPAELYDAAGLAEVDLSRQDDALLDRLRASRRPHLAVEALRRTLDRNIQQAQPDNIVRQEALTARTRQAVDRYANGLVTAAEVMASLVALAREVSDDRTRAQRLELTEDELAFYDALVVDTLVTDMMGSAVLARLACELYGQIRSVTTVDWRLKDHARDRVVARVLRLLRRHGYPPDRLQTAVERVLRQAEEQADEWM
ncbi:type I restriction endonuclease subunit R [Actinacidiphila sp. bgisy145]|uniref:type I restriction endonuclease subunit R n=1 Tax=Actinacidiphila sp. bgisy145 TaxID=3413792 RepID=UPI003EBFE13B